MMENKSVVALGIFDGVHLGHQKLIRSALAEAERRGCGCLIYTFKNHPMSVFAQAPAALMSLDERLGTMRELGAAETVADEFTRKMAVLSPEDFAALLVERFGMTAAVAGFNYTFGAGAGGDVVTLARLGDKLGFDTIVVDAELYSGKPVSSSRIRAAIAEGRMEEAGAMLGRPYALSGEVVENRRIGREIGFPTANIKNGHGKVLPKSGVYATRARMGESTCPAVTNIGRNPTVGGSETTIETHIIGFSGDIYGVELTVEFLRFIRGDMRFGNTGELAAQIGRDVEKSLEFQVYNAGRRMI